MKLLIDFFPVLLFFIAYKLYDIYVATLVAILASLVQVIWLRLAHGRSETMHLVALGLIVVFGGLTIVLQDRAFVMWKPSIVYWLFAAVYLASQFIGERPLIERIMGHAIAVPRPVWRRLNLLWAAFFLLAGFANLYMANRFFVVERALVTASGQEQIDLESCSEKMSSDELLALCLAAKSREDSWVDFKLYGMMGLTIAFVIAQAFYLGRHMQDSEQPAEAD